MMRKLLSLLVAAVAVVSLMLPGSSAHAQNRGSITGHVFDASGIPLKGVTVTATSPTQIGGSQVVVTDDQGGFKLQGLAPGKFKLTVTSPRMRTLVHENVNVVAANTTDIDLIMDVETGTEEKIEIIQKAPIVNQSSTRVGMVFDEEFMSSLPLPSRDYQGVASLTPGVSDDGSGNPQVRGGTYFQNNYTVDGFNTTDPVTHTFGQNFSFNSMANVEVTTAGGGAEMSSSSGGNTNIVTKSGSNRLEIIGSATFSDNHLQLFRDNLDRGAFRAGDANLYVGGPILRDKLWYSISGKFWEGLSTLQADPNFQQHPPEHDYGFDGSLKLSWRATQRNQLDLLSYVSPGYFNNIIQSPLVEAEAEARQFQRSEFMGLTWQYTGEIFLLARASYKQMVLETGPQRCEWDPNCATLPAKIDVITGVRRENYTSQSIDQRRSIELSGQAEYLRNTSSTGGHAFKFIYRFQTHKQDRRSTVPGDFVYTNAASDPFGRTAYCSSDPKMTGGVCVQNYLRRTVTGDDGFASIGDSWKPTRYLTIKPEVAFHMGSSQNDRGLEVTDIKAFTPHLSVMWDPTHDGKTKLFVSFDGKVDTGFLALAGFTSRQLFSTNCDWDPGTGTYSRDCFSQGGSDSQTVGLPCSPTGFRPDGTSCREKLRPPRVWELALGGQREIVTGVAVGVDFLYRKFVHQWEDLETNGNWNEGGTSLRQDGPFKTSRSQFVFDLGTPDSAERLYRGVTVQLMKREGRLRGQFAYTLSKYEGVADEGFVTSYLDNPSNASYYYGPLATDSRHELIALATYQLTRYLMGGVTYRFRSGRPYNRYYFDPVYNDYSRFQAQRGTDSRGNLNPEDDLQLRLPDISQLGVQVRVGLEQFIKQKVYVFADLLNLLALRTTTSYIQQDGPNFGRVSSRLNPMRVRVGLEYRY